MYHNPKKISEMSLSTSMPHRNRRKNEKKKKTTIFKGIDYL